MGKQALSYLLFLLNLATLLITSLALSNCPPCHPLPPHGGHPPHVKPPTPVKPPYPPHISPPKPPIVKPPTAHPPPNVPHPSPPYVPHPSPPYVPNPPVVPSPRPPQSPPVVPSPTPPAGNTCSIDTLKLGACVDLLGGLVHVGIGGSAKDTCCPVLQGLADLDAAVCLCTTIKAKLLNINIIVPIALQLLVDCGKTPPEGFKCPV
ncbi:36.4 kDa proline-rich protein-like [Corylus avellana]|uniref:36.4 kDa proline-rich protein-like n=1 Tax=Corylus avellana TaxID=13451 RepID=UPI00286CAE24|nr:36.4 kDa proline-rich protein-like [Corylus avellana]